MTELLKVDGLSAGYGGSVAVVRDMSLRIASGEVVALLGANGAGKTTTLLALAGELPILSGTIRLFGEPARGPLHARARRGLAFVPEERGVFKTLTTIDNLRAGNGDAARTLELFPELRARLAVRGGLLSGGEQQMLALGRALSRQPKLLLADEMSLGLAPKIVHRLLQAVRRAATEEGAGVLLVEQHVRKVLQFADRVYVMGRGELLMEATASDARRRITEIENLYLARR